MLQDVNSPEAVTAFRTPCSSVEASARSSQFAAMNVISDSRSLVLIMRGGEIGVMPLDDDLNQVLMRYNSQDGAEFDSKQVEITGSFDDGIQAASWNPDESVLALIAGTLRLRPSMLRDVTESG
jgi:elongator complex protein 1